MGKGWGVRGGVRDRGRLGGHGQPQIFVCCFFSFQLPSSFLGFCSCWFVCLFCPVITKRLRF